MPVPELVLSYIQTLVWPVVVIIALVLFRNSIRGVLKRISQFDAFGVTATMAEEARDVEDALAVAAKPDVDQEERKVALVELVQQATELGRLQEKTGGSRAPISVNWSENGPRVTAHVSNRKAAHRSEAELTAEAAALRRQIVKAREVEPAAEVEKMRRRLDHLERRLDAVRDYIASGD